MAQYLKKAFRFEDHKSLQMILGEDGLNLDRIGNACKCQIQIKGLRVMIQSVEKEGIDKAAAVINQVRQFSKKGGSVSSTKLQDMMAGSHGLGPKRTKVQTGPVSINPKTPGQRIYWNQLIHEDLVFGVGPAGTGKSHLAVAAALKALDEGQVRKIIITRPVVEAGEKLGFLPGGLEDKLDPYLRPLYDAMETLMGKEKTDRLRKDGLIEIAPLAYLRGRTLSNAFIILDEAQNTTPQQIRMFLTRMGEGSKMVITGDRRQSDLPGLSGLNYALAKFRNIEAISIVEMTNSDVVRHPLVGVMLEAFGDDERPSRYPHARREEDSPEKAIQDFDEAMANSPHRVIPEFEKLGE